MWPRGLLRHHTSAPPRRPRRTGLSPPAIHRNRRLKRRPPASIIDAPTHWDVGPWWNWQHVWLWTRRFQVRVLAGQSGQQDPAEGWPSGLRRRPAKALTRKSLVGSNPTPSASEGRCGRLERVSWVRTERPEGASSASPASGGANPTPSASLPPASLRRLPDGWPSGLRRTPGERVGSNPASWVRIPPRPLEQFPTRQVEDACPRGFEPSDRRSRARRVPRSGRKPTEQPKGASSGSRAAATQSHPVRPESLTAGALSEHLPRPRAPVASAASESIPVAGTRRGGRTAMHRSRKPAPSRAWGFESPPLR